MIGQLINTFEASPDNSVEAFNKLFRASLTEPSDSIVTIGEMVTGGLREITIDGVTTLLSIEPSKDPMSYYYVASKEGCKDVIAERAEELAELLGTTVATVSTISKRKGGTLRGYSINKVKIKGK